MALTAKGLDTTSGALQPELALEHLGRSGVMLCGPSFADEVALQKPCCLVAAAQRTDDAAQIAALFHSTSIRVYTSDDPIGVAVGASVKNVIAIAAGITGAMGLGDNARAALITRDWQRRHGWHWHLGASARRYLGWQGWATCC